MTWPLIREKITSIVLKHSIWDVNVIIRIGSMFQNSNNKYLLKLINTLSKQKKKVESSYDEKKKLLMFWMELYTFAQ